MVTRRAFALSLLGMPALTALARQAAPIRVVLLRDGADSGAVSGVRFGAAESRHTAQLFRREFELIEAREPKHSASATGVIITNPVRFDFPGVVLYVTRQDRSTRHFRVLPDCHGRAWSPRLRKFGAEQLNARYVAATGQGMDEGAWAGWMAVKILLETGLRVHDAQVTEYLLSERGFFDGHKGIPLRFGGDRVLQQPMYELGNGEPREVTWAEQRCG